MKLLIATDRRLDGGGGGVAFEYFHINHMTSTFTPIDSSEN